MKKFIITLVLAAMPFVTFAQIKAFDKFEEVEGIDCISLSKDMIEMATSLKTFSDGDKAKGYIDLIKDVDHLKLFSTSKKKYGKKIKLAVTDYLDKNAMEMLMKFNIDDTKVKIYADKEGGTDFIKQGLVLLESKDDSVVLVSFAGNLDLRKLEGLNDLKEKK